MPLKTGGVLWRLVSPQFEIVADRKDFSFRSGMRLLQARFEGLVYSQLALR
jgi:hypothetical protein